MDAQAATLLVGVLAWPAHRPGRNEDGSYHAKPAPPALLPAGTPLRVVDPAGPTAVVRHAGAYYRVPAEFLEASK